MGISVLFGQKWIWFLKNKSYRMTIFVLLVLALALNINVMRSLISYKDKMLLSNALIVLVITSYTDLKDRIVPNLYVVYLLCSWILVSLALGELSEFTDKAIFLLVYIPVAFLVFFLAKGGVGMGDVKLLGALSLYFDQIMFIQMTLLMSFFIFLLAVITLILRYIRVAWAKDVNSLPLVPFLFVSCVFIAKF